MADTKPPNWGLLGLAIAFLGGLLTVPSLWAGLHWDDIPMGITLTNWVADAPGTTWWDLFDLDHGDFKRRFGGRVPWWTVDGLSVRFFRPVAAATHAVDYLLWPTRPWAMHAQSVAWFVALVFVAVRMYRTLLVPRVAVLSGVLYATSYVHAVPVGWISNRNAVISAVFSFLAVTAYIRWRRGTSKFSWSPFWLLASILATEGGIATLAFVAGFELTEGQNLKNGRVWKCVALVLVVLTWRVAYNVGGFGAVGSGGYVDPVRSPDVFLQVAPGRFAWLAAFLLTPLRLLFIHGLSKPLVILSAVVFFVSALLVLREALRPEYRLWLISSAACLVPALASSPGDRLLTFAAASICPVIAAAFFRYLPLRGLRKTMVAILVLTYGVASPFILVMGSYDQSYDLRGFEAQPTMASVSSEDLKGRHLFILNSPNQISVNVLRVARRNAGLALPAFTWNLFPSDVPGAIERRGCCTLEISNENGLSRSLFVVHFRGVDSPMHAGEFVETIAFSAEVLGVTEDGVPTRVRFVFKEPLESYRNVFATWNGEDFVRVDPRTL